MTEQRPDERVREIITFLRIGLGPPKDSEDQRYTGVRIPDLRALMDAHDEQRARAERADALNLTLAQAIERADTELHHGMPDLALETLREAHRAAKSPEAVDLELRLRRAEAENKRLREVGIALRDELMRTTHLLDWDDADSRHERRQVINQFQAALTADE